MKKSILSILNRELSLSIVALFPITILEKPLLSLGLKLAYLLALVLLILGIFIFYISKSFLKVNFSPKKSGYAIILVSLTLVYILFFAFIFALPESKFQFFEVLYQKKSLIFTVLSFSIILYTFATILFEGCKKFVLIVPLFIAVALFLLRFQCNAYNVFLLGLLLIFSYSCIEQRHKTEQLESTLTSTNQ